MSFNVLIRANNSVLPERIGHLIEATPYELLHYDSLVEANHSASVETIAAAVSHQSCCILIHFLPDDIQQLNQADIDAAKVFAGLSERLGVPLIQMSHYRVFAESRSPVSLTEESTPEPDTDLGRQLLQIEQIAATAQQHIIMRLADVIGAINGSVFERVLPLVKANGRALLSDCCSGAPVSVDFIAQSLVAIIQQTLCGAQNWGVFHLRSADACTEAEIADYVVRYLNAETDATVKLPQISSEASPQIFTYNAKLTGRRVTDCFGVQFPSWRHGLKKRLAQWLAAEGQQQV